MRGSTGITSLALLLAVSTPESVAGPGGGQDCNRNGIPDERDLLPSPLSIRAPRSYNVRTQPEINLTRSIVAADLDADGILDLATANASFGQRGEVSVFLGEGMSLFQPPRHIAAGDNPIEVVAADLDGDGILDLAVANSAIFRGSSTVSSLLGNGDGTFREALNFDSGEETVGIVAADLDADGVVDVATANSASHDVSVLLGNGDGSFQATRFPAGQRASGIVALHLDGDGILDLATVNDSPDNVSLLLGNGDGSFGAPHSFSAGGGDPSSIVPGDPDIFAADLDSDGFTDLVLSKPDRDAPNISVILGNGEGTFGDPLVLRDGENARAVIAADVDGDGILDLAAASLNADPSRPRLSWRRGVGDGTFEGPEPIPIVTSADDLTGADLDGDGILDLAVVIPDTVLVYTGKAGGGFHVMETVDAGDVITSVKTADLNNDGAVDLLATDDSPTVTTGRIATLLGNGDGTFQPPQRFQVGQLPQSPLIVDVNSDGVLDFLSVGNAIRCLLGRGDGTFEPPRTVGIGASSISSGDLDGDGAVDLVARNLSDSNPGILILMGRGDGAFRQTLVLPVHSGTRMVLLDDLNGDGVPDLLAVQEEINNILVRLREEDRLFGLEISVSTPQPTSVMVLDVDRDGAADILAGSLVNRAVFRSLGNGDGTFEPPVRFDMQLGFSLSSADMNADGVLDIVSGVGVGGAILLGKPDGTFEKQQGFSPGFFSAGDVSGDGIPDLVSPAGPQTATRIALLINQTTPPFSSDCNRNSMPDECDIESGASHDGDRDGVPDECETNPQLPGDCNQDGFADMSDLLCLVNSLFNETEGQRGRTFPCETMEANRELLDWNGDGGMDISDVVSAAVWLFVNGQAHVRGSSCSAITGCLAACAR